MHVDQRFSLKIRKSEILWCWNRFFETLCEKYPNMEFFLVVYFCIRTEYGEILRISPYSVRMRENNDQKKLRIWTLFTQCFRGIESNQWHEMVSQFKKCSKKTLIQKIFRKNICIRVCKLNERGSSTNIFLGIFSNLLAAKRWNVYDWSLILWTNKRAENQKILSNLY